MRKGRIQFPLGRVTSCGRWILDFILKADLLQGLREGHFIYGEIGSKLAGMCVCVSIHLSVCECTNVHACFHVHTYACLHVCVCVCGLFVKQKHKVQCGEPRAELILWQELRRPEIRGWVRRRLNHSAPPLETAS